MPTKRTKITRSPVAEISPDVLGYLETGETGERESIDLFLLRGSHERLQELWAEVGPEIVSEWIKKNPCTRPSCWWKISAPRWERKFGAWFDGTLPEPRLRLGGIGTPEYEVLNFVPRFERGIPAGWVDEWAVSYYNGRSKDIHGRPIGTEYKEGNFSGVAIDPGNPPIFESEGEYLRRNNLLTDAEKRHLEKHPELLEPEKIEL